jgi:hypothetical protein
MYDFLSSFFWYFDILHMYNSNASSKLCAQCPSGQKMLHKTTGTLTTCAECDAGQFQNEPGIETCNDCPIGYYQNEIGVAYCIECIPGIYSNKNGSSVCDECPAGFSSENPEYNSGIANQHKISNEAYDVAQLCVFFLMYN